MHFSQCRSESTALQRAVDDVDLLGATEPHKEMAQKEFLVPQFVQREGGGGVKLHTLTRVVRPSKGQPEHISDFVVAELVLQNFRTSRPSRPHAQFCTPLHS